MSDDSVKVAVRIRPLVRSEVKRGCQNVLNKTEGIPQIVVKNGSKQTDQYTFNHVFDCDDTQNMIYSNAIKPMIQKLFEGYNVTILAYGQTGSGKTHTMGTAFDGTDSEEVGVIPRAVADIFDIVNEMKDYTFNITCSFMELYQEQLYDLLSTSSREESIVDIREDSSKNILIPNLTEKIVNSGSETTDCLIKGSAGRATGATAMNASSSRSHAIYTLTIQMMKTGDTKTSTRSKFHLVDLAGSERSKKTQATGDRFKEGVKINQGLLALGNVISALGTAQANAYISYRDSKLTRLLQDSLGGNSVTLMIACVSPADYNIDETLSTLRYADRAKQIKNKPIVNQDPKTAEINRLNGIIQTLRLELLNKNAGGGGSRGSSSLNGSLDLNSKVDAMKKELKEVFAENQKLTSRLECMLHDAVNMEHRLIESETVSEELLCKIEAVSKVILDLNATFTAETCPAEFVIHAKSLNNVKNMIVDIESLIKKNNDNIVNESNRTSNEKDLSVTESIHNEEEIKTKIEIFTTKQVSYRNELQDIKNQLALKEEHHRKLNGNFSNFCSFEEGFKADGNIKDYESIIQNLEKEKEELKETLKNKNSNISAKLAEDRRKRVQTLELEIVEMKKKNKYQAQLLKQREKDATKITLLQKDIQDMKQKKVKLIRTMKTESEDFRQWKLMREKEIIQLKEKDRKRENEMIKKQALHEKQRNVLKRKVEESVAVNKRLKEALDKHKNAQASRKKSTIAGKVDHIGGWMDQELEVIVSVIDAKQSLDQLIEDRGDMNVRLLNLKKLKYSDPKEIAVLQEEIEMRNAQILDLRDKIKSSDIESKMKDICNGLSSLPEARAAIKHLFSNISELRTEYVTKVGRLRDVCAAYEMCEDKIKAIDAQWRSDVAAIKAEKDKTENDYEEKIAVLLHELNTKGKINSESGSHKIQEEMLEALQEKIECYEKELNALKSTKRNSKATIKKIEFEPQIEFSDSESDDTDFEDDILDPDYRNTPANKRAKQTLSERNSNETNTSNKSEIHNCTCKLDCKTKQCGCKKNGFLCHDGCKCSDNCVNVEPSEINLKNKSDSLKRSNSVEQIEDVENINHTFTPKKIKLAETMELDLTTTPYPYEKKKRRPLLN